MALVEASGIQKTYWLDSVETNVLKGINLSVEAGELLAIVGASGAGKSTLLHILGSLDRPTEGRVLFEGEDLYRKGDAALSRIRNRSIGFVFQFHHLMPEFSALENVMMPLLIRGEGKGGAGREAKVLLDSLGLGERLFHRPRELSGGEQQRVAVARALIGSPKILFADEPTGNLDRKNGENLIELLLRLHRERGMALVLVTHNSSLAASFAKKVVLQDGRIAA